MFYRTRVLVVAFVAGAGVFSGTAFGQSIEGLVRGPDGKALKDAEVRFEQKANKSVVTTKTDARGHYSHARLSPGVYKVRLSSTAQKNRALTSRQQRPIRELILI